MRAWQIASIAGVIVGKLDGQQRALADRESRALQGLLRGLDLVHDQAQDRVIDALVDRERVNHDLRGRELAQDLAKLPDPVAQEDGELRHRLLFVVALGRERH